MAERDSGGNYDPAVWDASLQEIEVMQKREKTAEYTIQCLLQEARDAIEERGITQRELAEISGIAQGQISQYLSGKLDPRISTVVSLMLALDCTIVCVKNEC